MSLNKPDVIVLCEVRSVSSEMIRKFFKNLGYDAIRKKSGVVVAAKFKLNLICVTKSVHDNVLAGCVKVGCLDVTIVALYGPQESEKVGLRTEFYEEVDIEIQACLDRGSQPVLIGDLNAKIVMDNNFLSGVSPNGSLLKELLVQYKLNVLNFSNCCSGKWTRSQSKKGTVERSIIDYVITNETIADCLVELTIDEDRLMAPFWIRKTKKSGELRQFSDHNPFILTFSLPQDRHIQRELVSKSEANGWYISPGGLEEFHRMTELTPHNLPKEDVISSFDEYMLSLMDSCFRKRKKLRKSHPNIRSDHLILYRPLHEMVKIMVKYMQKGKSERNVAKGYIKIIQDLQNQIIQQKKSMKVAETMANLTDEHGHLSVNKFWKLKKSLSSQDNSRFSIFNKENVELFSPEAIKQEYQNEFSCRLSHKAIDPMFQKFESRSHDLFELMLKVSTACNEEPDFSMEEVRTATLSLNTPSSAGSNCIPPEVYVNAGRGFFVYLTAVLNAVKRELSIPAEWFEVLIVTLFKNKGSRKLLEYYRGIFLSNVVPKIMEKLIKKRISIHLKKVNLLQGGSAENRSACDIKFLLYGIIDHAKYLNKQIFLTFYDYSTCFDSLWLEDSMITLWELGIRNELFALIYKLNEVAKVRVKTPFGLTNQFECPRIVKQGSVLSSNLCSSSTAQLCDNNHVGGIYTGSFVLNDVLYVDDTTDVNDEINETDLSHQEVVNFSKCKRLTVNYCKCAQLAMNKKSHHSTPTLTIGEGVIPQVKCTKCLGDMINEKGTNVDMIEDRIKKAKAAMTNCLSICNEVTMGLFFVGSTTILYRSVFLATLLSDCQTWRNLTNEDMRKLETTQLRYLKRIMKAPLSTPNMFVYLEFGALPVKYIIHIRQLTHLYHILCLEDHDPVKKMFYSQQFLPYEKNWANEVIPLLRTYHLPECDIVNFSRHTWKERVKYNVTQAAFAQLTTDIKDKTKTKHLSYNSFKTQPYMHQFNHNNSSLIFKLRSFSIDCKANRKSSHANLSCRLCNAAEETQSHMVNCSVIRKNNATLDLTKIMLCNFSPGDNDVLEICKRVEDFGEAVNDLDSDNSPMEE